MNNKMEDITKIIYDLRQVNGLANFNLLSDKDRFSIIALEDNKFKMNLSHEDATLLVGFDL